jgi:hypothetical protein
MPDLFIVVYVVGAVMKQTMRKKRKEKSPSYRNRLSLSARISIFMRLRLIRSEACPIQAWVYRLILPTSYDIL